MIGSALGEGPQVDFRARETVQSDNDMAAWTAPVIRWVEWDAHPQRNGAPASAELAFVDPLLRRRLSPLARISLKVAHDCAGSAGSVRMVYASRHGELNRTTEMLQDLAAGEPLSPTAFSMSVLNASAGLFSIARKDTAPATAVSAGDESFGFGLVEASLQLASNPGAPVLLVFADEPVPDVYGAHDNDCAHAVGLLLGGEGGMRVRWSRGEHAGTNGGAPAAEPQSRAFLRCLRQGGTATWRGERSAWSWNCTLQ
jgi:hypothetical protein